MTIGNPILAALTHARDAAEALHPLKGEDRKRTEAIREKLFEVVKLLEAAQRGQ